MTVFSVMVFPYRGNAVTMGGVASSWSRKGGICQLIPDATEGSEPRNAMGPGTIDSGEKKLQRE